MRLPSLFAVGRPATLAVTLRRVVAFDIGDAVHRAQARHVDLLEHDTPSGQRSGVWTTASMSSTSRPLCEPTAPVDWKITKYVLPHR